MIVADTSPTAAGARIRHIFGAVIGMKSGVKRGKCMNGARDEQIARFPMEPM
jgi:hypothetical protein